VEDDFFGPPQPGLPDWSRYRGADTVEAEVFPQPVAVKVEQEERPMTEEEELEAAILASQLEEERQWQAMGQALHDSWMAAQAAAPAPPPPAPAKPTPPATAPGLHQD
jgi:hypothetical protein